MFKIVQATSMCSQSHQHVFNRNFANTFHFCVCVFDDKGVNFPFQTLLEYGISCSFQLARLSFENLLFAGRWDCRLPYFSSSSRSLFIANLLFCHSKRGTDKRIKLFKFVRFSESRFLFQHGNNFFCIVIQVQLN